MGWVASTREAFFLFLFLLFFLIWELGGFLSLLSDLECMEEGNLFEDDTLLKGAITLVQYSIVQYIF